MNEESKAGRLVSWVPARVLRVSKTRSFPVEVISEKLQAFHDSYRSTLCWLRLKLCHDLLLPSVLLPSRYEDVYILRLLERLERDEDDLYFG